jgi:hypothetical protein
VRALPESIKPQVIDAFANALQVTFTVGAGLAALAIVGVLMLPRALQGDQTDRSASVGASRAARAAG